MKFWFADDVYTRVICLRCLQYVCDKAQSQEVKYGQINISNWQIAGSSYVKVIYLPSLIILITVMVGIILYVGSNKLWHLP